MVSTEDFQKIVKAGDVVIFSPVGHFGTKGQVQGSYYVAKNGVVFKSSSQYGFTFPSTVEVITGSFNEKS